jgi:hypothetical protein
MKSLRAWLITRGWFIVSCVSGPGEWHIKALAPSGRLRDFWGSEEQVTMVIKSSS